MTTTGAGRTDPALFRRTNASTAQWFVQGSSILNGRSFAAGRLDVPSPAIRRRRQDRPGDLPAQHGAVVRGRVGLELYWPTPGHLRQGERGHPRAGRLQRPRQGRGRRVPADHRPVVSSRASRRSRLPRFDRATSPFRATTTTLARTSLPSIGRAAVNGLSTVPMVFIPFRSAARTTSPSPVRTTP